MSVIIETRLPTSEAFISLRGETTWGTPSTATTSSALAASLCGAVAIEGDQTVGMIRAVGDGALNVYIQDVIVTEAMRRRGIGKALLTALLSTLSDQCPGSCMVGLFAADGQSQFYERFGFISRPGTGFGPGMHAVLSNLATPDLAKAHLAKPNGAA